MLLTLEQIVKIYNSNSEEDSSRVLQDGQFWITDYFVSIQYDDSEQFKIIYRYLDDYCGHAVGQLIIDGEGFEYVKHIFTNRYKSQNDWLSLHPNSIALLYDRHHSRTDVVQHPTVADSLKCDKNVRETAEAKLALLVLRYS